jgi:hypothetical protein
MCNANPLQLAILQSINTHRVQDLENFLSLHNFELSCFLKHGINAELLNAISLDLLKKHVNEENITARELLEAGMSQSKVDGIFGEKPVEVVCPQCSKTFQTEEDFSNFKMFCGVCNNIPQPPPPPPPTDRYQQIRNNDQRANATAIKSWFDAGEITIEGLIDHCGLSEDIARRLSKYYTRTMKNEGIDVKNLPSLKPNRTDFYFLGMPAAGKSCLVASQLAYWEYRGIYNPDVNNPRSLEYTDVLLDPFTQGYLPNRTDSGFLDYINCTLNIQLNGSGIFRRGQTTRIIPINILDMAGEAWRKAAQEGAGLPDHRKYLDNQNEKAMLIVIDADSEANSSQIRNLVIIFSYFDEWKIWDKTASVGILISKADKLSSSKEYEALKAAAELFYNSPKCVNLKKRIDERSRKFRFQVDVLPYSIGECRWGQFLLNPDYETNRLLKESAEHLTEWILDNTGGDNSGGFGGLFSN